MENNWCILNVDENDMWATFSLKKPVGDEAFVITADYIEDFLKSFGITYGINRNAIEMLASHVRYGQSIVVATGLAPVNGVDGHVEFLIPVEDAKKPIVSEDGSVDYLNSLKLAMVEEGQIFANYIPSTLGKDGLTIYSRPVKAIPGKETKPYRGKGFEYIEQERAYKALYSGHISCINNRITIDKLYVVNGDLDIDTGNVTFNGDVQINGDVRSGMSITADGCIYINGHVGGCNIFSKQNIIISKGIQGRDRCIINATGDVTCRFVERCTIYAGGNIYADSVLNSEVVARNQIIITSRNGAAIGGSITGMLGVTITTAGNETGVATVIRSGPLSQDIERLVELTERLKKTEKDFNLLNEKQKKFDALPPEVQTEKTADVKRKILRAKVVVSADRQKINEELLPLSDFINLASSQAFIHITGVSYPGTVVKIGQTTLAVTEAYKDVTYKTRNGMIEASGT